MRMTLLRVLVVGLTTLLAAAQAGDSISGKVVNALGVPVPNTKITVRGAATSAFSGLDGSYKLSGLTPGTYTLVAECARFWPASKSDVATGRSADFQLIQRQYLTKDGHIIDNDFSIAEAKDVLNAAKLAGDTQAEYVAVNTLLLKQPNDLELKKQSSELEKELTHNPAHIDGTIVDASGSAVPHATVTVKNETTGKVFTTNTNNRGEYQLLVYPVGKYEVDAMRGNDSASTKIKADIMPNIKVNHDIQLSASAPKK